MRSGVERNGFTLLEIVVALAILALSLTTLLDSQATSLNYVGLSRDVTVASLLARAKMVDAEVYLFEEGFTLNETEESGDFSEEGYKDYKWKWVAREVKLDLSGIAAMCDGFLGGDSDDESGSADSCSSLLGGVGSFGGSLNSFTDDIAQSLRLVVLEVTWGRGIYSETIEVRSFVSRPDFGLQPALPAGAADALNGATLPQGIDPAKLQPAVPNLNPLLKSSPTLMPGGR